MRNKIMEYVYSLCKKRWNFIYAMLLPFIHADPLSLPFD